MMRIALFLFAAALAGPALAQHAGHGPPQAPISGPARPALDVTRAPAPTAGCTPDHEAMGHCKMPSSAPAAPQTCTPEHAAMGHCTMPQAAPAPASTCTPEHAAMGHCTMPAPAPTAAPTCTPEHAAMGHCTLPRPAPAPASTCTPEHAAMGHCKMPAGHAQAGAADPHAGHEAGAEHAPLPPITPPPPEALTGPAHAADLVFDPKEMARSRAQLVQEHGGMKASKFLVDQLEISVGEGQAGYSWDAQAWYGGDRDKFWLKTEGEGEIDGGFGGIEAQALWSHALDPWFDLQAGVRQDLRSGPDRTHLVLGVQGLAPYWFEVEGALFLSTEGEVTARAEAEYDLRLTSRLILQPLVEADFSFRDVPELGLGDGLTSAEIGARLRYEFFPEAGPAMLAPYFGVKYERAFGDTARFRRLSGEEVGDWRLLLGLRTWF